jgi:hypothetical protein
MGKIPPDILRDPEDYAQETDDSQLMCRANQHRWPRPRPGKPLPRRFIPVLQRNGGYRITEYCEDCGKKRIMDMLPGGVLEETVHRGYRDPERWKRIPRAAGMRKRDWQAEYYRRLHEEIVLTAVRAAENGQGAREEGAA